MKLHTLFAYTGLFLTVGYLALQLAVDVLIRSVRRELGADERLRHICEHEPSRFWYRHVGYYASKTALVSSNTAKKIRAAKTLFFVSNLVLAALFLAFILGNILQRM
jgi:heme O synthase-like polyprenyltransferase